MKILYVITSTHTGGAEQALVSLVNLIGQGNTVRVVCLKPLGPLAKPLKDAGAEIISFDMKGAGLGMVARLVQEIEAFRPDIVHAMLFRAILFARLACAGRKVKLVTTPHFDLSKKPFYLRWADRVLKNIDTYCVAESASTYNYLLQVQHYPPLKTALIANSAKKSLFFKDNSLRNQMRASQGFMEAEIVFICVARLAPVKNHITLLKAFAKISPQYPQARLVLVGAGTEKTKLETFIQTHALEKQILLAGEQKNINAWLNMADVFVLVSKEESLPLALLEAQQVGLPCIVSRVGDMPQKVKHGETGFVCNGQDETVLSCILAELCENETLRARMARQTLHQAAYSKDFSQQYQQFYEQLLKK